MTSFVTQMHYVTTKKELTYYLFGVEQGSLIHMVFMHLWNSSTNAKCTIFLVFCVMPLVHDQQTDRQTDTLIRVRLGNLISGSSRLICIHSAYGDSEREGGSYMAPIWIPLNLSQSICIHVFPVVLPLSRICTNSSNLSGLFFDIEMNSAKYVWIHLIQLGSLLLNSLWSSQSFHFSLSGYSVWCFLVNFRSFCPTSGSSLPLITTSHHHITMHHTSQGCHTSPQTSSTTLNSPKTPFSSSIITSLISSKSWSPPLRYPAAAIEMRQKTPKQHKDTRNHPPLTVS